MVSRSAEREQDDDDSARSVDYGGWSGLREFFGETTMHGVQYTFRGSLILRIIWTLGVLGCLGGFMYFFIKAIIDYRGYPTNTKIDIVAVATLPVPAITICNTNFAQASAVARSIENDAFVCEVYNTSGTPTCPYSLSERRAIIGNDTRRVSAVYRELGQTREQLLPDVLTDMLSYADSSYVFSEEMAPLATAVGLCHTYNSDGSVPEIRTTGVDGGAKFIVNVDQNEYAGVTLLSAGVEVYLHNPGEPVIRGRNPIYVGPGQRANIALLPQRRTLQDTPYRTPGCTRGNLNRDKSNHYSVTQCLLECVEQAITDGCGCLPHSLPVGAVQTASNGRRISRHCSLLEYFDCSVLIRLQFERDADFKSECKSHCLQPCEMPGGQYTFSSSLSSDLFPNYIIARAMIIVLAEAGLYNNQVDAQDNLTYIRENFAQINVYYNALSYNAIDEQKALTLPSLFGSVGGNLGLFLGASLLTLLEFAQFVTRFCRAKFHDLRLRRRRGQCDLDGKQAADGTDMSDIVS